MRRPAPFWKPEDDALLLDLLTNTDLSGLGIGARMGKTRNSIIGRVHRLGLSLDMKHRGQPLNPPPPPSKPTAKDLFVPVGGKRGERCTVQFCTRLAVDYDGLCRDHKADWLSNRKRA